MPQIYLSFLWHMHQPFYKDLITGEYKMPWTRLHALKDYYGMVQILEEFPEVKQTFNLVPSLMKQVEEYAEGKAADPFLEVAVKPAEALSEHEQEFLLSNLFAGNPARLIYRFPRYGELYDAWRMADRNPRRARRFFGTAALRDLQVYSQLSWFDEEYLEKDAEVAQLVEKARDFSRADQETMARKQREILGEVQPAYAKFAARGQIEISTTPFYHPILPLLCDSDIAAAAHPYVPLPTRFRYPQDAREQLESARKYIGSRFGTLPSGLWPSEGSVSDEVFQIASDLGFRWAATDNGVLARTLGKPAGVRETYKPYRWQQGRRSLHVVFRDHTLSDLIGFVYSRMGAAAAAADFLSRIRENCREILAQGRDAFVPIILDGENAWEFYERNGRPFLRELYRRITEDPQISALTVGEALGRVQAENIDHIFPGSWINANFDIWIGAEEDNRAWEYLLRARQTYDAAAPKAPENNRKLAWEELLIAEGSDWCWWYGPEHSSDYRAAFDRLFRDHLANVYRALNLTPPEELSRPILKAAPVGIHTTPTGPVKPKIDGEVTSYFEWLGAGLYKPDTRSGSMHGRTALVRELHYGCDGVNLYLRLDFEAASLDALSGMEIHLNLKSQAGESFFASRIRGGKLEEIDSRTAGKTTATVESALHTVFEARVPLSALGAAAGQTIGLQASVWQAGLPMDAVPQSDWLDLSTAEPTEWPL